MSYHFIMSSPLHFTLQQHSQQCQYVTVECDCGCHVLLVKMEFHLNNECPWRLVKCKGCGEEMSFIQLQVRNLLIDLLLYCNYLQSHDEICPNAVKMCRNCNKQFPACQVLNIRHTKFFYCKSSEFHGYCLSQLQAKYLSIAQRDVLGHFA